MSPDEQPMNAVPDPSPEAGTTPPPEGKPDEERTPAEIRAEIVATREELGDTVEALAAKTDVKAQARAKVEDLKAQAQAKAEEAKAKAKELGDKAKEAAPESPQEAQGLAKQNPKPLAIAGGVVVLFLLWRWLRS
jgi:ElaB/YqjD/DUF883 family membrane-anchored ribosome-binding protein